MAADFGDAPTPYPAASHEAIGPTLGMLRDTEAASQPTAGADGDGADDDGVTFGVLRVGQVGATVTVNVQNAPSGARLDGWIDFNGDGNWGGPGEQILSGVSVAQGASALSFDAPSTATDGTTMARFRVSSAGGLGIGGAAFDGEVEDYAIEIDAAAPALAAFTPRTAFAGGGGATVFGASAADVDGDGDMDLLSAGNAVRWHENLGNGVFTARTAGATPSTASSVVAADLDGDGDLDLVAGAGDRVYWFENDGSQTFTSRLLAQASAGVGGTFALDVEVADLDGDGDLDVVAAWAAQRAIVYANNGSQTFTAAAQLFPQQSSTIATADIDGDGALDIIVARRQGGGDPIYWFRNLGGLMFQERTLLGPGPPTPSYMISSVLSVAAVDVDNDGRIDVVAGGSMLVWYRNTGTTFTEHVIESLPVESVAAGDVDGDGDLDLLTTGPTGPPVHVFENFRGGLFQRRAISTGFPGYEVVTADLDGDGDLDAVSAGGVTFGLLAWHENVGHLVDLDFGDAPAPYPTLVGEQGALHGGGGPRLGLTRDVEGDGQPSTGDGADEDGAVWGVLQAGSSATLVINISNAPAGAVLDAWIDFNGDGSWNDANERIAIGGVVEGENSVQIFVPATAMARPTFARLRISTAGGLGPTGAAADGEVEDYAVTIAPPMEATGEYAPRKELFEAVDSLKMADFDGDGDLDLLTDSATNPLSWHENLGDASFLQHLSGLNNVSASDTQAVDLDRDGDIDVVATDGAIVLWFENNGQGSFRRRSIGTVSLASLGTLAVADAEGDGDWDVLIGSNAGLQWALNGGNQQFQLVTVSPSWQVGSIRVVAAGDLDGDGDVDIACGRSLLTWFENVGPSAYVRRQMNVSNGVYDISIADLDGDGDADMVVHVDGGVLWMDNQGSHTFVARSVGSMSSSIGSSNYLDALTVADGDGDGDLDVYAVSGQPARWFRNDGGGVFVSRTVTTSFTGAGKAIAVGDVNGDGDLEILLSASGTGWFEAYSFGDYDRNGRVEQTDRDLWEQTNGQSVATPGAGADGDRSGTIDEDDLAVWEAHVGEALTPQVRAANTSFPGTPGADAIDGDDFLAWQRTLGMVTFPGAWNDWDYSGAVDAGDLEVWRRQFGQGKIPDTAWINSSPVEASLEPSVAAGVVAADEPAEQAVSVAAGTGDDVRAASRDAVFSQGDFFSLFAASEQRPWGRRRLVRSR